MRKILYLFLIVSQIFFINCEDFDDSLNLDYEECIRELESKKYIPFADYEPGEILIIFKEETNRNSASELLDNQEITDIEFIDDVNVQYEMVNARVPHGKEFEIICEMRKNKIIDGVYLQTPYNNKFKQFFVFNDNCSSTYSY